MEKKINFRSNLAPTPSSRNDCLCVQSVEKEPVTGNLEGTWAIPAEFQQ